MDIFGIGPLELLFIFLIALIFLGPNDMVKAGRTLGRTMRKVVTSDAWREITRLRTLPNQLMREAGLEEDLKELNEIKKELPKALEIDGPILEDRSQPGANPNTGKEPPDLSSWTEPQAEAPLAPNSSGEAASPASQEGEQSVNGPGEKEPARPEP